MFVVPGSSLNVSPANSLPRLARLANGAGILIVNREETPLDELGLVIRADIGNVLAAVDEVM